MCETPGQLEADLYSMRKIMFNTHRIKCAFHDVILSELSADAPEFQPEANKKKQEPGKEQVMPFYLLPCTSYFIEFPHFRLFTSCPATDLEALQPYTHASHFKHVLSGYTFARFTA